MCPTSRNNLYPHYDRHNPGNIRYVPGTIWRGQCGEDNGFCKFESDMLGIRAVIKLLRGYMRKGYNSPRAIISRYAPSNENNTSAYIDFVCKRIGNLHDPFPMGNTIYFGSDHFRELVKAILWYESKYEIYDAEYEEAFLEIDKV